MKEIKKANLEEFVQKIEEYKNSQVEKEKMTYYEKCLEELNKLETVKEKKEFYEAIDFNNLIEKDTDAQIIRDIKNFNDLAEARILKDAPKPEWKWIELPDMSSALIGTKVKIRGMVSKATEILNEKYKELHECDECGVQFKLKPGSKPYMCYNQACKTKGSVRKIEELYRDFREIEIEETIENIDRQPERIRVRILGSLLKLDYVKKLQVGQMVEIIGKVDKEKTKVKNDREIYSFYLIATNLDVLDYTEKEGEVTEEDLKKIHEIAKDNPLEYLTNNVAPNLYGNEVIKKSILLQAVRGPENIHNVRPRIHILLVGDPSTSKSRLGWEIHKRTPKSIYGSGDNMSRAGLTSSVEKDELSGRWIARAGLLCRANKSLVIIDEADKLKGDDRGALHTPMEDGVVIVDKAGIHTQMKADCSILAICNPKNGSFDTSGYNPITKEVNLPEPIISRFDLIFYMRDIVDKHKDKKIIESLFLKKEDDPIKIELFKKYISYASKIEPKISKEVQHTLTELYEKLRTGSKNGDNKITARQAGGLMRLAVAHAKIRLSDVVENKDLEVAEGLMLDALESVGFARNLNALDQASIYSNTTKKKMNAQAQLVTIIKELIISGKDTEKQIENFVLDKGHELNSFRRVFEGLSHDGTILKSNGRYKWLN